jgi:hypothetical protein
MRRLHEAEARHDSLYAKHAAAETKLKNGEFE